MKYRTTTITRHNLESIPFQHLPDLVEEEYEAALASAQEILEARFASKIEYKEAKYRNTNEAPSETTLVEHYAIGSVDKAEIRYQATQKAIRTVWLPRYSLESIMLTVMPQIIAYIGNKTIRWNEVATVEGQINGLKLLKAAFDFSKKWDRGLYQFLMLDSRSDYLDTQYKGESKTYCALVPLIMYAFKSCQKIKYNKWDRGTLHWVVNRTLCNAMLWEGKVPGRDELIAARKQGLVIQSGVKAGQSRNPATTYKLFGTKGSCLEGFPDLVNTIITQIWCAHPTNRTPYMILDPNSWDSYPEPLIDEQIVLPPSAPTIRPGPEASPWEV